MKAKKHFAIILALVFIIILATTCKRTDLEEPSPVGPSSISILLNVTVSPNVLRAGNSRGVSTITANLRKYDGTPLSSRTVYFAIYDGYGNKIEVGYFEGYQSTVAKATDGNGIAQVKYYGPLLLELGGSATIYIGAHVAWEGRQFISERVPLKIIGETIDKIIHVFASPSVLYAGTTREMSMVKATLETAYGTPLANMLLRFEIKDADGNAAYTGYFADKKQVETKVTDEKGRAQVDYYGPLDAEIEGNTTVYIHVTLVGEETTTEKTPIYIYEDGTEALLNISADPSSLSAGTTREESTITATLEKVDGTPIANQTITFDIIDDTDNTAYIGYFEDNKTVIAVETDANGQVTLTYYGPLASELPDLASGEDTTIYIRGTVDWGGGETTTAKTPIYITVL